MKLSIKALSVLFTLALMSFGGLAFAQTGSSTPAATATQKKEIPAGFEPIKGKERKAEEVSAPLLVVVSYGAFFLLMFGYIIHVVRSQASIGREMQELSDKIRKRSGS